MPLLIFIYSMMWQLICKYEPFWQEVSVEPLILGWPLRSLGLLFNYSQLWLLWQKCKTTWNSSTDDSGMLCFIYRTDFHHHCNIKMWNLPIWNHVSNRNYPITAVVSLACPHNHRYVMDYTCCCFVPHAPSHHRKP